MNASTISDPSCRLNSSKGFGPPERWHVFAATWGRGAYTLKGRNIAHAPAGTGNGSALVCLVLACCRERSTVRIAGSLSHAGGLGTSPDRDYRSANSLNWTAKHFGSNTHPALGQPSAPKHMSTLLRRAWHRWAFGRNHGLRAPPVAVQLPVELHTDPERRNTVPTVRARILISKDRDWLSI